MMDMDLDRQPQPVPQPAPQPIPLPQAQPQPVPVLNPEQTPGVPIIRPVRIIKRFYRCGSTTHMVKQCDKNKAIAKVGAHPKPNSVGSTYFFRHITKNCRGCTKGGYCCLLAALQHSQTHRPNNIHPPKPRQAQAVTAERGQHVVTSFHDCYQKCVCVFIQDC